MVTTIEQLYQKHIKPIPVMEQLQLLALISQHLALTPLVLTPLATSRKSKRDLETFFRQCDNRELGIEPEWQEHLAVIQQSRSLGQSWN